PFLYWDSPKFQLARGDPSTLDANDRNVLLVRIADQFEHLCGLDVLYYEHQVQRGYLNDYYPAAEWAGRLGLHSITVELAKRFREIQTQEAPVQFPPERIKGEAFVSVPKSLKRRLAVRLKQELIHQRHRIRNKIAQFRSRIEQIYFNTKE